MSPTLRTGPGAVTRAPLATLALALLLAWPGASAVAQDVVPLRSGMVVRSSTRVEPGTYRVAALADTSQALIIVRGDDLTLDLTGVTLEGMSSGTDPDLAAGIAVRVQGGSNVTIRGGTVRGYRVAVLASGTRGLHIVDGDFSYNWKPRLFSLVGHESLVDWLSFHDNEDRNWMRFGSALYLEDVRGGEIRGIRAVQGMNGLLMTRTDSVTVMDNDFSFNSGLGIGLYRSSHNRIVRNRLDYDVRGYSEGFYQRGQDSAGLLLYEQSSRNLVAYNSATHSGDGLFLWAGNSTMDTGQGGANDNLLFYNDFSFAPTNAVEVTFSRNRIVGNLLHGSRYGVWGGYSWETEIRGNCFAGNQHGVAIEHGQDNRIVGNRFDGDSLVISLWARESQPEDWGYPRNRDVRSRGNSVTGNTFVANARIYRLERTSGHSMKGNHRLDALPEAPCDPRDLLGPAFDSLVAELPGVPASIPSSARARLPRSAIVVDEWGPYDGRSPKLWPTDTSRASVPLVVLGPPGEWRVTERRGIATLSPLSGHTGDTLRVVPDPASTGDWSVTLEYTGEETLSPRGEATPAGVPVPLAFERFEPAGPWDVRFVTWTDAGEDPTADPAVFADLIEGPPALTRSEARLDYQWYRPLVEGIPQARWALEATATVSLPPGEYSLRTISDDGIRVWVDGELVIDHWQPHGSEVAYAPMGPGEHELRVQYYQLDGWAEIRVEVVKGSGRSVGSAGPH